MEKAGLIAALNHEARQKIISLLKDEDLRHSELARELSVSSPEVSRHCRILAERGAVRKHRGKYMINNTGKILASHLRLMGFLEEEPEFIEEHDFSMLPEEVNFIGVLERDSVIRGPISVLESMLAVNNSALDSVNCILEEGIDRLALRHLEQLEQGLHVNILIKEGERLPSEYLNRDMFRIEIRQIPEIPLGMVLTESQSIIVPRHMRGMLDYAYAIAERKEPFLRASDYIFYFFWGYGRKVIL